MALIFSSSIARFLKEKVIFKICPNTFVHEVNSIFRKVFPIFFFFFGWKNNQILISTLTSSFIGLFLASLCLILLNFRVLHVPERPISHILFSGLWRSSLFVAHWCFNSYAQEKVCSSFCLCKYMQSCM